MLTIVVTVYNTEPYLKRCLDSCLNQEGVTLGDFEVVVVNDGSPDHSKLIIDKYVNEYPNIRCIDQENQGLSIARNNGMKASMGDYVWFVDSDDWINPQSVNLIKDAMKTRPDVIPIRAINDGSIKERNALPANLIDGKDVLKQKDWNYCGPFYIYRKGFMMDNDFFYYPGIYHEDAELTPRILYAAKTVKVVNQVLYYVYQTPGSIMRSPKVKKSYDCLFVAERLYSFTKCDVREDYIRDSFYNRISVLINNGLSNMRSFDKEEKRKYDNFIYEHKSLLNVLKMSCLKNKIEWILFSLFPKKYVRSYQFLKHFS